MSRQPSAELEIRSYLLKENPTEDELNKLIKMAESKDLSDQDLNSLATFFLRHTLHGALFKMASRRLEKKRTLPWPQIAEALMANGDLKHKETQDALLAGAEEDKKRLSLLLSPAMLSVDDLLATEVSIEKRKIVEEYEQSRYSLPAEMQFLFTQHLIDQERALLSKYEKLFPGDKLVADQKKLFLERNAREVIARRASAPSQASQGERYSISHDDQELAKLMYQTAEPLMKESDTLALDLAVAFETMEAYDQALAALAFAPPSPSALWLRCEILVLSRRYLEALDAVQTAEQELASDPETVYACAYLRAQCLWGLGEKSTAVEILEGLVGSRPQYRSATALLLNWRGGSP